MRQSKLPNTNGKAYAQDFSKGHHGRFKGAPSRCLLNSVHIFDKETFI